MTVLAIVARRSRLNPAVRAGKLQREGSAAPGVFGTHRGRCHAVWIEQPRLGGRQIKQLENAKGATELGRTATISGCHGSMSQPFTRRPGPPARRTGTADGRRRRGTGSASPIDLEDDSHSVDERLGVLHARLRAADRTVSPYHLVDRHRRDRRGIDPEVGGEVGDGLLLVRALRGARGRWTCRGGRAGPDDDGLRARHQRSAARRRRGRRGCRCGGDGAAPATSDVGGRPRRRRTRRAPRGTARGGQPCARILGRRRAEAGSPAVRPSSPAGAVERGEEVLGVQQRGVAGDQQGEVLGHLARPRRPRRRPARASRRTR